MTDLDVQLADVQACDLALDGIAVPDEDDRGAELADGRGCALDDHGRAVVAPHGVDRDLQLATFGRDDLATLVVPAVRAHAVRELRLAALWTHRAGRVIELVVGAALAPPRYGVASFRQRH